MRWKLGNYTLKYNPKELSRSWQSRERPIVNLNGEMSNPNLIFDGAQKFTIEIFDKPTYIQKKPEIPNSYIASSENRYSGVLYLLKSNGTFDVKTKAGIHIGTYSITAGSTALPTGYPSSIAHTGNELVFLYKESSQATVFITAENGVGNRKYIYSTAQPEINQSEFLCWDFNSSVYLLNPFGRIFSVNLSNGSASFVYEFQDFTQNKAANSKRYTSIMIIEKSLTPYIGVLQDKKDIVVLNPSMKFIWKVETNLTNIIDVTSNKYSEEYYMVTSNGYMRLLPNLCGIDLELVKISLSSGQVTVRDELGFPSVLSVKDVRITRNRNMSEARYEVEISTNIVYSNQGFDDKWQSNVRGV